MNDQKLAQRYENNFELFLNGREVEDLGKKEYERFNVLRNSYIYHPRNETVFPYDQLESDALEKEIMEITSHEIFDIDKLAEWLTKCHKIDNCLNAERLVDYLFTSTRTGPAIFAKDTDSKRFFCVDYKKITVDEEYDLASNVYYSLWEYLDKIYDSKKINDSEVYRILKIGEDIALGSFILQEENQYASFTDFQQKIIKENVLRFDISKFKYVVKINQIQSYFDFCLWLGRTRANGFEWNEKLSEVGKKKPVYSDFYINPSTKIEILPSDRINDRKDIFTKNDRLITVFRPVATPKIVDNLHEDFIKEALGRYDVDTFPVKEAITDSLRRFNFSYLNCLGNPDWAAESGSIVLIVYIDPKGILSFYQIGPITLKSRINERFIALTENHTFDNPKELDDLLNRKFYKDHYRLRNIVKILVEYGIMENFINKSNVNSNKIPSGLPSRFIAHPIWCSMSDKSNEQSFVSTIPYIYTQKLDQTEIDKKDNLEKVEAQYKRYFDQKKKGYGSTNLSIYYSYDPRRHVIEDYPKSIQKNMNELSEKLNNMSDKQFFKWVNKEAIALNKKLKKNNYKVLFIENDEFISNLYDELFKLENISLDIAKNGQIGLLKMVKNRYDLVITNVMLPVVNGINILKAFKTSGLQQGKIIFLTSMGNEKTKEIALYLGADGYEIKGENMPHEIISKVISYLTTSIKPIK